MNHTTILKQMTNDFFSLNEQYYGFFCDSDGEFAYEEIVDRIIVKWKGQSTKIDSILHSYLELEKKFWDEKKNSLIESAVLMKGRKIILWGDMGILDVATRYLLLYDTIFVPDPIYDFFDSWEQLNSDEKILKIVPWLLFVHNLKILLDSGLEMPLIVFYPQFAGVRSKLSSELGIVDASEIIAGRAISDICGIEFRDINQFIDYIRWKPNAILNKKLDYDLLNVLIGHDFLYDKNVMVATTKSTKSAFVKMKARYENGRIENKDLLYIFSLIRSLIYMQLSRETNGSIINSEVATSETFFGLWGWRNDCIKHDYLGSGALQEQDIISHSFQTGFKWLNNLSIDECIRMRQDGYLDEVRRILAFDNSLLATANSKDYAQTAKMYEEHVIELIQDESKKMQSDYSQLKKKYKLSAVSLCIGTTVTIGSFIYPPLSIMSAILGVGIGTKSIMDILNLRSEKKEIEQSMACRPTNILMQHYNADI